MKIKILKCTKGSYWYHKHIGEEFEADDHNSEEWIVEFPGWTGVVLKQDCETIQVFEIYKKGERVSLNEFIKDMRKESI